MVCNNFGLSIPLSGPNWFSTTGAGLALHFSVPLAIDTSAVAMPGCLYGFTAATAGMSYILSRLPHNLGEYLALTGKAIRSSDLVHVGLAKMFTPGDRMDLMEAYLGYVEQHGYKEAMEVAFLFAEDRGKEYSTYVCACANANITVLNSTTYYYKISSCNRGRVL